MTMMEQLGELYNAQGQFQDSIKVYRNLMVLEPSSPKLCYWQGEVMKNTLVGDGLARVGGQRQGAAAPRRGLREGQGQPRASRRSSSRSAATRRRTRSRELATVWHKEAQKTNNNDTYALAQYLYKEYLTRFPKEKDVYQMTFYYGELLFKLGSNGDNRSYCNAAPVYTKVVELNPSPTAKYLKEAAYAAVISWKNCLSVDDGGAGSARRHEEEARRDEEGRRARAEGRQGSRASRSSRRSRSPTNKKKMVAAFDTYIKYVPDSPELPNIKYRKARIYYEANHFDEAMPLFKDIADHHPTLGAGATTRRTSCSTA